MAAGRFLQLFTLSALALLVVSFGPGQANALSLDKHDVAVRQAAHAHGHMAKKKRQADATSTRRCKPRSTATSATSSSVSTSTLTTPAWTSTSTSSTYTTTSTPPPPPPPSSTTPTSTWSSSSSVSSPSSSSTPPPSSGGKVGLAWPNGGSENLAAFKGPNVNYLYSWSPDMPPNWQQYGYTACPMLWGQNQISDFQSTAVAGAFTCALGFNEPDQSGQSSMDAGTGAQLWQQYIQPLKAQGYILGTPAVSSAPAGKTWMQTFFADCTGCTFDFLALHWYGTEASEMQGYILDFYQTFNLHIWVTEFACQSFTDAPQADESQVWSFYQTMISWMEAQDYVDAYFPFGAMEDMQGVNTLDQLMGADGNPNALGAFIFGT